MTKNEEIQDRLLECATRHFRQKGYAAVNMVEIAADAGVSRGPLYYYFSNKAELYRACVHRTIENQKTAYARILSEDKSFLDMAREDYQYCMEDKGLFFLPDLAGDQFPELVREWQEFSQWLIGRKYQAFSAAQQRGEIPADRDISEIITFIYVYYYGIVHVREMSGSLEGFHRPTLEHSIDSFLEILRQRFL